MDNQPHKPSFPFKKYKFAHRLRNFREAYGLRVGKSISQAEMGKLLGVSRRVYLDWENPTKIESYPRDIDIWISMSELFEADLIFLITGLFDGKKERSHQDKYLNIYTRYLVDPNFHLLLSLLMRMPGEAIKTLADHYEAITDHYEGGPPIL